YLGFSYPRYDPIFARFTTNLTPEWTEYGGSPSLYEYSWRIVSRGDGTFYAAGYYYNSSVGQDGGVIYRINSTGAIVGSSTFPTMGAGGSYLHIQDIAVAPDGSVLLSGASYRSLPKPGRRGAMARSVEIPPCWLSALTSCFASS